MFEEKLTFDDVLLLPAKSGVLPSDVDLKSKLTNSISLNVPLISAAMDTVTEHETAIALAKEGGIGIIHKNLSPEAQAREVRKVKRSEFLVVVQPITLNPESTLAEINSLRARHGISSFPVVDSKNDLKGIITSRDLLFEENPNAKAKDLMTKELITALFGININEAKKILRKNKIEKLLLTDKYGKLQGMMTSKDLRADEKFPNSLKDKKGQLMVGAAIGVKDDGRLDLLIKANVDVLVIDTAHGHSLNVLKAIKEVKKKTKIPLIVGNVATAQATKDLIAAGADAVKVGIGPGAICTTRIISGVGVPQLSAIQECAEAAKNKVPIIADGGMRYSGDIVKAIAAGANVVMLGSLFAGCEETPGRTIYLNNRKYKQYRGMGSITAMKKGSKERYSQGDVTNSEKFVPEGIEGIVPFKGTVSEVVHQLMGGLRSGMGYTGSKNIQALRTKTKLCKISKNALDESHPHSMLVTEEAPNYQRNSPLF